MTVAVLASGGLDSSVLCADLARAEEVVPLRVEMGLAWEELEGRALDAFLAALRAPRVRHPTVLELPVRRLYGEHWSTTGEGVPGAATDDRAVELPGRNVLLLALAGVWCALHGVRALAIGSLSGNPFPDATPAFFDDYARSLSAGLARELTVLAPYRGRTKAELVAAFASLPLERTLTCLAPRLEGDDLVHCGACNKCEERRQAFRTAGVPDRARYAVSHERA